MTFEELVHWKAQEDHGGDFLKVAYLESRSLAHLITDFVDRVANLEIFPAGTSRETMIEVLVDSADKHALTIYGVDIRRAKEVGLNEKFKHTLNVTTDAYSTNSTNSTYQGETEYKTADLNESDRKHFVYVEELEAAKRNAFAHMYSGYMQEELLAGFLRSGGDFVGKVFNFTVTNLDDVVEPKWDGGETKPKYDYNQQHDNKTKPPRGKGKRK